MCALEGLNRKQASERLGIPEGTLSSRLAKARKLLAERLRKRGISVPVAGLMILAQATVSPRLLAQTSALHNATAPLPSAVATISNGVLRTMLLHKLTLGTASVLLLVVVGLVAWSTLLTASAKESPKPLFFVLTEEPKNEKPLAAKPAGPGTILLVREGPYHVLTPEGKRLSEFAAPKNTHGGGGATLSPDGKRVAFIVTEDEPPSAEVREKPWPFKIVIHSAKKPDAEKEKVWDMPASGLQLRWTADGKRLIAIKYNDHDLSTAPRK